MRQFAQFPNGTALYNQYLTQTAIDRYLTENPFNAYALNGFSVK